MSGYQNESINLLNDKKLYFIRHAETEWNEAY